MNFPLIRLATNNDTRELYELHKSYQKENLKNITNGFLSRCYSLSYFEKAIEKYDILAFDDNGLLVGYVLINTVENNEHLSSVTSLYSSKNPSAKNLSVAYSYQILIVKQWQGTGFFSYATESYFRYYSKRYDILVSTISKENQRSLLGHLQNGWNIWHENDQLYFVDAKIKN